MNTDGNGQLKNRIPNVPKKRRKQPSKSPSVPAPAEDITLAETEGLTVSFGLLAPTVIFTLGTTGATVGRFLVAVIRLCCGCIPDHLKFLYYDATANDSKENEDNAVRSNRGGAGSRFVNGVELFAAQRSALRLALRRKIARLRQAGPDWQPRYAIGEALDVHVIGGFGGSSSGAWDGAIDLVHGVAAELELHQALHLHAVVIDPEMALRDIERKIENLQAQHVRANAGILLEKFLSDFVSDQLGTHTADSPFPFAVEAAQRLRTIRWFGRSNGQYQFDHIDDLCRMAAHALFMQIGTHAGKHLDDRFPDLEETGVTGRYRKK